MTLEELRLTVEGEIDMCNAMVSLLSVVVDCHIRMIVTQYSRVLLTERLLAS